MSTVATARQQAVEGFIFLVGFVSDGTRKVTEVIKFAVD
jgi:hypothetical protein